ncbi:MAG: DMT family transporter [Bythopirellula sp.]|nr:DMT family transporter [Bythopirellula sp.]
MPKWIVYTLLTVLLWGFWGVTCKAVSADLPAWQLQVMSLLGVLPVVAVLMGLVRVDDAPINRRMMSLSFGAGLLGCVGNLACFEAMSAGGKAAAVIPLTSLYPITTVILAFLFLKERPTLIQAIGIGLSLVAIWLFNVAQGSEFLNSWLLFSLLPIVCWGIGGFIQKLATSHITGEQCALAFLLGFFPMVFMAFFQESAWGNIPPQTWALAILSGLLFALGNLTVIYAYHYGGPAVIVTPAAGLYMLIAVPLAVLLLNEKITSREGLGIVFSVLAVIALCWESNATKVAAESTSS